MQGLNFSIFCSLNSEKEFIIHTLCHIVDRIITSTCGGAMYYVSRLDPVQGLPAYQAFISARSIGPIEISPKHICYSTVKTQIK